MTSSFIDCTLLLMSWAAGILLVPLIVLWVTIEPSEILENFELSSQRILINALVQIVCYCFTRISLLIVAFDFKSTFWISSQGLHGILTCLPHSNFKRFCLPSQVFGLQYTPRTIAIVVNNQIQKECSNKEKHTILVHENIENNK